MNEKIADNSVQSATVISRRRFLKLALLFFFGASLQSSDRPQSTVASATLYDSVFKSLLSEASARRNWHLIDKEVNHRRVNILLFSFGELYEPSEREEVVTIGSPTIVSLSPKTIDFIPLTHEIRSPEVERYLQKNRLFDGYAKTIDKAYFVGGFELLRPTVESATGLSVDFQAAFNETVIADAIDKLYGRVEVDVPLGLDTDSFYFRGKWYPKGRFLTGKEMMDGTRAIQFMKTMPYEKAYNRAFENTTRKHVLLESLRRTFESSSRGVPFWWGAFSLLYQEIRSGELTHDVNLGSLLFRMIGSLAHTSSYSLSIPRTGVELYVSDPANSNLVDGLGGMQWIAASQNPIFKKEWKAGFYRERAIKVPFDSITPFEADPYDDDLIRHYWRPIRSRIKQALPG